MKKTFKFIGWTFGLFFAVVLIMLIIDISNDVDYEELERNKNEDSLYLRITTEATKEEDLRKITEDVKKKNKDVDAIWLWIYNNDDDLLAKARIPNNSKGMLMVGADSLDYIFEMED